MGFQTDFHNNKDWNHLWHHVPDEHTGLSDWLPQQQGLKPTTCRQDNSYISLSDWLPQQQGLKHSENGWALSIYVLSDWLPQQQGLKQSLHAHERASVKLSDWLPQQQGLKLRSSWHHAISVCFQTDFHNNKDWNLTGRPTRYWNAGLSDWLPQQQGLKLSRPACNNSSVVLSDWLPQQQGLKLRTASPAPSASQPFRLTSTTTRIETGPRYGCVLSGC